MTLTPMREAAILMKFAFPSLFSHEVFWLAAAALAAGLVVAWILRGAPPGQAAKAEDDAEAPRSGYRDRMIAGVVMGLLLIAGGGYAALVTRHTCTRCRSSRWDSAW